MQSWRGELNLSGHKGNITIIRLSIFIYFICFQLYFLPVMINKGTMFWSGNIKSRSSACAQTPNCFLNNLLGGLGHNVALL